MPEPSGTTQLLVCVTCRATGDPLEPREERSGARLHRALLTAAAGRADAPDIVAVECLSVCKRPCTIGLSARGKWTYVYGDFATAAPTAEVILDAAALYEAAPDGLIPWKQRPDALKKGVVARIPPQRWADEGDAATDRPHPSSANADDTLSRETEEGRGATTCHVPEAAE